MSQVTVVFLNVSMETQTEKGELGPWKDWLGKLSAKFVTWLMATKNCQVHDDKYFLELGAAARHINKDNVGACALNQGGIYMWQYYQRY